MHDTLTCTHVTQARRRQRRFARAASAQLARAVCEAASAAATFSSA